VEGQYPEASDEDLLNGDYTISSNDPILIDFMDVFDPVLPNEGYTW
jgi:hypothetical protein